MRTKSSDNYRSVEGWCPPGVRVAHLPLASAHVASQDSPETSLTILYPKTDTLQDISRAGSGFYGSIGQKVAI